MRKLIFTFTIVGLLIAGTAFASRFDFILGEPAVVDDGEVGDTLEQSRYDFTFGEPSIVFDSTAVSADTVDITIKNGSIKIDNGVIIIK